MTAQETVTSVARTMDILDASGTLMKLDSLTMIDFVVELERVAEVEIPSASLTESSFSSIEAIAELIQKLKG